MDQSKPQREKKPTSSVELSLIKKTYYGKIKSLFLSVKYTVSKLKK